MGVLDLSPDEILAKIDALPASQQPEAWALLAAEEPTVTTVALTEYQSDPLGFFRDVLGIPENTIRWSLNAGYREAERYEARRLLTEAIAAGRVTWDD
jgi:hypothetical protein